MNILANVLTREQRESGIYLEADDHTFILKRNGKVLAVFTHAATIKEVRKEADQVLNWLRSGVEFGRRRVVKELAGVR